MEGGIVTLFILEGILSWEGWLCQHSGLMTKLKFA